MTDALMVSIYVFVLATFVGVEVIGKVPPLLHTPLMSGSNAISGITLVGSLIAAGEGHGGLSVMLGMVAVIFAAINVVGGFLVTDRMLKMFKSDSAAPPKNMEAERGRSRQRTNETNGRTKIS